jgi:copper chaperone CopZ
MSTRTRFRSEFTVLGMSCQHCAMSVTVEIGEIPGVSGVDVRLDAGRITVLGDREIDPAEVAGAVAAAGFELAG